MMRRDLLKMGLASSLSAMCTGAAWSDESSSGQRPNVLWLMTDEQRKDSLGCYGTPWAQSPNLDRLAREGAVFTSAYTPSPVCTPARICLLTGEHCTESRVWFNIGDHDLKFRFLTDVFREAGYATATFGKQHYMGPRRAFDLEKHLVVSPAVDPYRYSKEYDETQFDVVKHPTGWILGGRYPAPIEETAEWVCVEEAKRWLKNVPRSQPFLLRISFSAPHTPVVPPEPFDTLVSEQGINLPREADPLPPQCPEWIQWLSTWSGAGPITPEQKRKMRRYYYGYCAFVDAQFGRLLDWMRSEDHLDNTIVAFVSDHGTHLCDHGLVQKCTFYEPSVSVPYFFWYPERIVSGSVLNTPVETLSLLPTLLELAGLQLPAECSAVSLAHSLRTGTEPPSRPVFSGITLPVDSRHPDRRLVMVREGNWKLTVCVDESNESGELINLSADPFEQQNLWGKPGNREIQEHLMALIDTHITETPKPYANVRVMEELLRDDGGNVLCPLCRRAMARRVDGIPDWSEGLSAAFLCGHCGTRFGTKAK